MPTFANSSTATVVGGATNGNIFGSVQLDELNFTSSVIVRSNGDNGPIWLNVTYPNILALNTSWAITNINVDSGNIGGVTLSGTISGTPTWASGQTMSTLDTGQGANELYDMNQNVQTTDNVTFNKLTVGTNVLRTTTNNLVATTFGGAIKVPSISSSSGGLPNIITFTYPSTIAWNSSWVNKLNTYINMSTSGRDLIIQSDGGVGNEGPNFMLRATDADGVPSTQYLIKNGAGTWKLMASIYNDASHTTIASWQSGNQTQFFTFSAINPNTVSRKMFIDSGDTAEIGFTMNTWFRIYSDDASTEKFAINGQTGAIWTHGSITPPNNLTDIGSATKYFNAIHSYYSLHNIIRPINGSAVTIQDGSGNARFTFIDLASGSTDWAFVPTTTLNGNLGTSSNRWKASFIQNLDVSNQINLGSGASIRSTGGATPVIVTLTYPNTVTWNGTWAQNNFGDAGNDFGATNTLVATTFSGNVNLNSNSITGVADLTGTSGGNTVLYASSTLNSQIQLSARDVDGGVWRTFINLKSANVPEFNLGITDSSSQTLTGTWGTSSFILGATTFSGAITWQNSGSIGGATMTLGANSPAVTTTPATWVPLLLANGTTVYFPVWK